MRIVAVIAFTLAAGLAAAQAPSVDALFREFGLYGTWAPDCAAEPSPDNPHVRIASPTADLVLEEHNLGPHYAANRYSVLAAERLNASDISVTVIFQPGSERQQRQTLIFRVRDGTRRTMFNQPDGGAVRVKNGVALAHGSRTPLLKKCE
jgi:hypothetical protein